MSSEIKSSYFFKKIYDYKIEFKVIGESISELPTIILLHEGLGSLSMWKGLPEKINNATNCNIVVYSRAGYGKSSSVKLPRPLNYMSIEAEKYLPEIIKQLNLKKFFLLGHSDGGTIAALYSSIENNNDNHLGTILIAPHFFIEDFNLRSIEKIELEYQSGNFRKRLSKYHSDVDNAFYGWSKAWLDPNFYKWDITKELRNINVPVLGIQGNTDPYGSVNQLKSLEKKLSTKFYKLILDQCGHNPLFEKTEETIEVLRKFIYEYRK